MSAPVRSCASCGATGVAAGPAGPEGWSWGIEAGRTVWTCGPCLRDHIRAIEAKLAPEWW